jgi:high-affinity iron transporter
MAYLEGVEPVEMQLRANDASFVAELESQLGRMRSSIEQEAVYEKVAGEAERGKELIAKGRNILAEKEFNGWMSFLLSFSIIFREGLEAFLVIITILGIIRALNLPKAAVWVHAGWLSAIAVGMGLWLLAESLFTFTGAQREVMEGIIALFAVGVLLYVGFWMHSKSEAGKWQAYVRGKIQVLAKKENLLGLAFLSFLVVFREAFESVLFLSALNMEVGESHAFAFGSGIVVAFAAIAILASLLLRYSKKIPIPMLFKYSAIVISFLAVMLAGKGVHALQEAGMVSISTLPLNLHISLVGLYPTWETLSTQLFTLLLVMLLWRAGNRAIEKPICETRNEQQALATQKADQENARLEKHQPSAT